jgi:hypothetical protein
MSYSPRQLGREARLYPSVKRDQKKAATRKRRQITRRDVEGVPPRVTQWSAP